MLPNAIIAGCVRCGTTWLAANLRQHPGILFHKRKEVHFFDREENYSQGAGFYQSHFFNWNGQKIIVDASPTYFSNAYTTADLPARIHALIPETRFIVSLRNPVERLVSQYWHIRSKWPKNKQYSFEELLDRRPDIVREGMYIEHFENYLRYFQREQFHVVLFDQIQTEPKQVLVGICDFLQIDPEIDFSLLEDRINSAYSKKHEGKSWAYWYLHRAAFKLGWYRSAAFFERLNYSPKPDIAEDTRRWLQEKVYGESIRRLEQFLASDLSAWRAK
jgi:hypothetical protein